MMVFLLLLLALQSMAPAAREPDEQIATWLTNIEQGENLPESLWSISQIYRETEEYRKRLFAVGDSLGADWLHLLDRQAYDPGSLHQLALHFRDEHLHLYLQFHLYPAEQRMDYFDEFYSVSRETTLKEIARKVAAGEPLRPADFLSGEWNFAAFIVLYFLEHVTTPDPDFYRTASQSLAQLVAEDTDRDPVQEDFLYASLFQAYYSTDSYHEIASHYEELMELTNLPPIRLKRNLYQALDFSLYRTGYLDKSLEIQRRHTLPLSRQIGDREGMNAILATHGGYLFILGRYQEAKNAFQVALADSSHLTAYNQTLLLNNLSLVHYKLGESHLYVETQMQALEYAIDREDYSHQLRIYRNLHIYYRVNGNRDLALQYIEEAVELAEKTGDKNELASIMISRAVFYDAYLEAPEQALAFLEDAGDLLQEVTDYRLKVRILSERADLFLAMDEPGRSREIYREIYTIGSDNNNHHMLLEALVNLASLELVNDHPSVAEQYLDEFGRYNATNVDFHVLVDARRIRAEIAFRKGRFREAEELLSITYNQVLERARNTTDIEAGYWHVEREYLLLFELYTNLLAKQNRPADLVNILDQLKTFNDASLIDNPLIRAVRMSEGELAENRNINRELDLQRKKLLAADEQERLSIRNRISALSAQKNLLTRPFSSISLFRPVNVWALQTQLAGNEMILHTTRILNNLYLLMIDSRTIQPVILPFGEVQEEMLERAIRGLETGDTNLDHLYEVYQWLGLESLPDHITSLTVIPDSYLYQLPLDVLPVAPPPAPESYGSAEYLIEKMDVRYLNSLQDLMNKEPARSYEYDFAGIGISDFSQTGSEPLIPLPKAPHEIRSIVENLDRTGRKKTLLEQEGTPEAFSASASDSRILHLASHSRISGNDPLFSTLFLHPGDSSGEGPAAGQILAYQLFNMNLRNELVMLNSCESGSGEYFMGSGIMGISRALRYAGAKSLVLNSWAVNDQFASDFAVQFYSSLNKGNTKSQALRHAKMEFLRNKNANPHYWGSYMLNGDIAPIVGKPGEKEVNSFLALLLASLLAASWLQLSRHLPERALK